MHRKCPFWPDDGRCVLRDCHVEECPEVSPQTAVSSHAINLSLCETIQEEVPGYLKGEKVGEACINHDGQITYMSKFSMKSNGTMRRSYVNTDTLKCLLSYVCK